MSRSQVYLLASALLLFGCKAAQQSPQVSNVSQNDVDAEFLSVAILSEVPSQVRHFHDVVMYRSRMHDYNLRTLPEHLPGAEVSDPIVLRDGVVEVHDPNYTRIPKEFTYRGIGTANRVFVFRKAFAQGVAEKYWQFVDSFPSTYLSENRSLEYQVSHYMDALYHAPTKLKEAFSSNDAVDLLAHFLPTYSGFEKVFFDAQSQWESSVGIAEVIGDAASFGLSSKIRVVRQGAATVTLTASSIRLSEAGKKALAGKAEWTTGVDALLATTEAALASVTIVKLRLTPSGGALVESMDQARALSRVLGKSPDKIYHKHLSKRDLLALKRALYRAADKDAEAINNLFAKMGSDDNWQYLLRHIDDVEVMDGSLLGGHTKELLDSLEDEFHRASKNGLEFPPELRLVKKRKQPLIKSDKESGVKEAWFQKRLGFDPESGDPIWSAAKKSSFFPWTKERLKQIWLTLLGKKGSARTEGQSMTGELIYCFRAIIEGVKVFAVVSMEKLKPTTFFPVKKFPAKCGTVDMQPFESTL